MNSNSTDYVITVYVNVVSKEFLKKLYFPENFTKATSKETLRPRSTSIPNDDFLDFISKKIGNLQDLMLQSSQESISAVLETKKGSIIPDLTVISHLKCQVLVDAKEGLFDSF